MLFILAIIGALALLVAAILAWVRVFAPTASSDGAAAAFAEALATTAPANVGTVPPDSAAEEEAIARFRDFFTSLTPEVARTRTADVYAANAYLHDTLATHHGVEEIRDYFVKTAERASGVAVQIEDVVRSGPDFYFRWSMDITWSAFRSKGETTRSVGVSLIRFDGDGKVVLHHDFWDSAGGFFEHLPVVGWMIRALKAQVAKS